MRFKFFNTFYDNYSFNETVDLIDKCITENRSLSQGDINVGKFVLMQQNTSLLNSINNCDLINIDGQGFYFTLKLLGYNIKEKVSGVDLMNALIELAAKKNYKIFLLGAEEEVVQKMSEIIKKKYPINILAGFRNGYFNISDEEKIAKEISDSGANILFVGISSPIKEEFINRNSHILKNINFKMGVGGSFDVYTGKVKRAPYFMQKYGLEWFWRFLQEPKRMYLRTFKSIFLFIIFIIKNYKSLLNSN